MRAGGWAATMVEHLEWRSGVRGRSSTACPISRTMLFHESPKNIVLHDVGLSANARPLLMHLGIDNIAAAAVSDKRKPYGGMSWSVVARVSDKVTSAADEAGHTTYGEERIVTSEKRAPYDDFEDIDPSVPVFSYIRADNVGRFATTCKPGLACTSAVRRVTRRLGNK